MKLEYHTWNLAKKFRIDQYSDIDEICSGLFYFS